VKSNFSIHDSKTGTLLLRLTYQVIFDTHLSGRGGGGGEMFKQFELILGRAVLRNLGARAKKI
jgi:hypothetical protein